jgi:hypothetical protein
MGSWSPSPSIGGLSRFFSLRKPETLRVSEVLNAPNTRDTTDMSRQSGVLGGLYTRARRVPPKTPKTQVFSRSPPRVGVYRKSRNVNF